MACDINIGASLQRRSFMAGTLASAITATGFPSILVGQHSSRPTPKAPRRLRIDSDAKNEIDDQFAIVRALIARQLKIEGITAAGYTDLQQGAQRSFDEIQKILKATGVSEKIPVALGSAQPMKNEKTPQETDAAELIIKCAMEDAPGPLYVLGLGQFTNLASALLMEPKIQDRVVFACIDGDYRDGRKPAWGKGIYNWPNDVPAVQAICAC